MTDSKTTNSYATPIAVVIAGLLIAGAVLYGNVLNPETANQNTDPIVVLQENIDPITEDDHIRGNANAKFTVIEYSDLECPFCKIFHYTMTDLMAGREDVRWVFRHLPLESLHAKAIPEAIAAECAADLGGDEIFWQYIDKVFETTSSNDGLDLNLLPQLATGLGLDKVAFTKCLDNQSSLDRVTKDLDNAISIGADGTPFVVVIGPDGQALPAFKEEGLTQADTETQTFINNLMNLYSQKIQETR
ncbi:MAG: DsbA family protein [Candidatus Paceibacterota bacterium]